MRIAIVHHNPQILEILRRTVVAAPACQTSWLAGSGAEAVTRCHQDRPDLILMDLYLPNKESVQAIRNIMKQSPCAILVISTSAAEDPARIFEAMGCGALDAVHTPYIETGGQLTGTDELMKKIAMIGKLQGKTITAIKAPLTAHKPRPVNLPPLVAIGSSTGGPKALATILSTLPAALGAAIIIVQHLDVQFAPGLADWLNHQTSMTVMLAVEGMRPVKDTILVAGTNDHLVLGSDLALHYTEEPRDYPYRPSVDVFFCSLEKHWPRRDIAVLLTGMGRDGAKGLFTLRQSGWQTIAQDEKTSTIYGMPAAAAELNAAEEILPLEAVAGMIQKNLRLKG